jgi:hypothetical protein
LKSSWKHILQKISNLPYFKDNTGKDYFFILFVAATLTIVAIDIRSEIAREKREIESIIIILENTEKHASIFELEHSIFDLAILGLLSAYNIPVLTNDVLKLPKERSPPQSPSDLLT